MDYLHDTPFEIERATDDESEYFSVYMIDYHYEAPSGRCLQKCVTPDEAFGEEDYEFVIIDDFGNRVAMELTGEEERDFLKFFFEQMED
jgi:hypothetical protein